MPTKFVGGLLELRVRTANAIDLELLVSSVSMGFSHVVNISFAHNSPCHPIPTALPTNPNTSCTQRHHGRAKNKVQATED